MKKIDNLEKIGVYSEEIFKIQTSFTKPTTHLVYNEDRTSFGEFPFDKQLFNHIKRKHKAFVKGYHTDSGKIIITGIVKEKNWPNW